MSECVLIFLFFSEMVLIKNVVNLLLEKIFNDAVHGPIRLHPLCVKIIDTPEFQRLRNIKQLGTTYLVYPAASHNRFEHSLGVCYLAGRMVNALRNNLKIYSESCNEDINISDVDKLCVEIAGLCHDIGHGPFSHLWELVLAGCGISWKHESGSSALFDHLITENNLVNDFENYGITENKRILIKELILGEGDSLPPQKKFLYQIVANKDNDIDVDKWDYFLRDGHQLNVKISFDYNRLLEFCTVVRHPDDRSHLVIGYRDKEADNLHDMFRVRTDLHRRAYQHCVVKNLDLMYIDAFIEANKHYKFHANDEVTTLSNAHNNLRAYSRLTDHVFDCIMNDPNQDLKPAKDLIKRILTRKLYTHIGTHVVRVPLDCNDLNVLDIKNKLNLYFGKKFLPHELRFCPIKLEYNRHIDSLKKVVVFDKRDQSKVWKIDVTKIIGPLPLEDSYTGYSYVQIHVYCQTHDLDKRICQEIDSEIKDGLFKKNILNNCNNNTIDEDYNMRLAVDGRRSGGGEPLINT